MGSYNLTGEKNSCSKIQIKLNFSSGDKYNSVLCKGYLHCLTQPESKHFLMFINYVGNIHMLATLD